MITLSPSDMKDAVVVDSKILKTMAVYLIPTMHPSPLATVFPLRNVQR